MNLEKNKLKVLLAIFVFSRVDMKHDQELIFRFAFKFADLFFKGNTKAGPISFCNLIVL